MTEQTLKTVLELFHMVSLKVGDDVEDLFGKNSLENHKRLQEAYKQVRELYEAIRGRDL
jgi:hypothetical protein